MKKFRFNLGVLLSLLSLAVGLFIFSGSFGMTYWLRYGPGEGFAPFWIGIGLVLFSAASCIFALGEEGVLFANILPAGKNERANLAVVASGLVIFLILVEILGFLLGSIPLTIMMFSRGFSLKRSIPLGITLSTVCYLLFGTLLEVPLPVGPFGF